jgi:imidazolonepropionase-like amidohydrolase
MLAMASTAGMTKGDEGTLALVGGRVHVDPASDAIVDGVVLVKGHTIAAVGPRREVKVPEGARRIDCTGFTITAGFWNSHVHFFERKWADAAALPAEELGGQLEEAFTRYGFTSVFDLGSSWANTRRIRDRIESGEVAGPHIRSAGEALVAPGAMPPDSVLRMLGYVPFPSPEISDAAQATAAARALIEAGVDGLKVHLQPPPAPKPPFPEDGIAAVVQEAQRAGRPVFVHPNDGADVRRSLLAGVDVIAHTTPRSGPWGDDILSEVKTRRPGLTPTLALWRYFLRHDRASVRDPVVQTALVQLRAWRDAGGTVLFGSDLGAVDPDPSEEYALMAQAGLSFRQILAALTTAPAARFGDGKTRGRVAPGFDADLAVIEGDPEQDVAALGRVRYTLRQGTVIHPSTLPLASP